MTTPQMRQAIKKAYSGDSWDRKVNNMSDGQVIAVYFRLLNDGKL